MKRSPLIACLIFTAGLTWTGKPAWATPVLSDDFEGYTSGQQIPTTDWALRTSGASFLIQNSGEFGASNQFVTFNDTSTSDFGTLLHTTSLATGAAYRLSLDFIATTTDAIAVGFAPTTNTGKALGSEIVARLLLSNGEISDSASTEGFEGSDFFTLNEAYRLTMVFNDSGSSISYGGRSIADTAYDVWIRDLASPGSSYVGSGTFTPNSEYFVAARSYNSPTPTVYFDNWRVDVVPEPSTLALVSLGILLLMRRR